MAIGTQFGFAVAGFAPLIESALIGKFGAAPFVMPAGVCDAGVSAVSGVDLLNEGNLQRSARSAWALSKA